MRRDAHLGLYRREAVSLRNGPQGLLLSAHVFWCNLPICVVITSIRIISHHKLTITIQNKQPSVWIPFLLPVPLSTSLMPVNMRQNVFIPSTIWFPASLNRKRTKTTQKGNKSGQKKNQKPQSNEKKKKHASIHYPFQIYPTPIAHSANGW